MAIHVRPLTAEEITTLQRIASEDGANQERAQRAKAILLSHEGWYVPQIARQLGRHAHTVRAWVRIFNSQGFAGLEARQRPGRRPSYTPEQCRKVAELATTDPRSLGLPFSTWSLSTLREHLIRTGLTPPVGRETLRRMLASQGVVFRATYTWAQPRQTTAPPAPTPSAPVQN